MNRKEKIILLLISIAFQIPIGGFFFVALFLDPSMSDVTLLIPVENAYFDVISLLFLSPLFMIIFFQCIAIYISILLVKFHNVIKFKRYEYAIFNNIETNLNIKEYLIRAFVLGFFALSVGTIINELASRFGALDFIVIGDVTPGLYLITATIFVLPILSLILIPVWLLLDTGTMCSRKKGKAGRQKLPDIEGVYREFQSSINGYIGISTIIAVTLIIIDDIFLNQEVGFMVLMFLGIFFSTAITMIPLLYYDWQIDNIRKKFIKLMTNKGMRIIEDVNDI